MQTVEEILKASGLTDEQVKALDAKVLSGFTTVISTATQTLDAAELAKRAQQEQYDKEIAPALNNWANDSANLTAERDYYKALALKAKEGGFVPTAEPFKSDATPGSPVKDPKTGQFLPSGTPVVAAPAGPNKKEVFDIVTSAQWTMAEYMRLHGGAVPPDDIETLANEAVQARMPYRDWVAKKYEFAAKREKIKTDAQKAHDDSIRKEENERVTKELTEKLGNNPNVRQAETSSFSEVRKAVKEGTRPDPLKSTPTERFQPTRAAIRKDIAARESSSVQ
jgi:hypothetical protein